jgi:hypothetical protein
MRVQKSKLKCIRHAFVFNDKSEVIWAPMDEEGKEHHGQIGGPFDTTAAALKWLETRSDPPSN